MKTLETAILFQRINVYEDFELLLPTRILYGESDDKKVTFTDYLSKEVYINSDIAIDTDLEMQFNKVLPLKKLMRKYKTKSLPVIFNKYLEDIKKNVYFYGDKYLLQEMSIEKFYEEYGIQVAYPDQTKIREQVEKLLNGDVDFIEELTDENKKEVPIITDFKISEICDQIRKNVVAQDEPIKKIVTAIYRNNMFDDPKMKSNIFVYGPTGVGKTEIVRTIGKMFDIPVLIEDMTRYTSAGYKGADLEDILAKLYFNAEGDLELAQKSILVLDEIDKKASDSDDKSAFQKDDVLKSLLKIIEGGVFDVEIGNNQVINFDTSKLTVITCGAFSDMYEKNKPKRSIGFSGGIEEVVKEDKKELINSFVAYGMPIEFMGRIDTIVGLNELKKEDLIKILKESELSPLKIYLENLKKINININFTDELCERIAEKAMQYKSGARSLKIVVDEMFADILYGIFDNPGEVEELNVSSETVSNNKVYQLRKRQIKEVENNG